MMGNNINASKMSLQYSSYTGLYSNTRINTLTVVSQVIMQFLYSIRTSCIHKCLHLYVSLKTFIWQTSKKHSKRKEQQRSVSCVSLKYDRQTDETNVISRYLPLQQTTKQEVWTPNFVTFTLDTKSCSYSENV